MSSSIHLGELLISRICHDLASPVGAVMSGLELIEEFEGETADDALRLMADSARIAARRMAFYRLAFGFAGNAANLSLAEARALLMDFLVGGRARLDWPEATDVANHCPEEGGVKLLLMLVFVALEALPRGGTVAVGFDLAGGIARIQAQGPGARIAPANEAALTGAEDILQRLDAGTAPSYYAGRLAQRLGAGLMLEPGTDRLSLSARLP
ncbi:MAG: hypothetical protein HYR63_14750 [Proteobacteria bacterium]|nr:hypothetical protein [Pseudomonadota bacterium]MBI3498760.1 hypothetical protein [Pseudomonadota bacterium]